MSFTSDPRDLFILIFAAVALLSIGIALGRLWWGRKFRQLSEQRNQRLFTIERALNDFWDAHKVGLEKEVQKLRSRIEQLETLNENYRKKLAKVGLFGMRRKESHLVMALLTENEALEERLYRATRKLHEERDEYLNDDLRRISYNRMLLSELLSSENVQREIQKVLRDADSMRRIELKALDGTAGAGWSAPQE